VWQTLLGTLVVIAAFMATYYLLQRTREKKREPRGEGEPAPPACDGACECCREAGGCRYAGKGPPRPAKNR